MPEIEANTVIVTRLLNQILLEAALSHVRRIALFLSATLSNAAAKFLTQRTAASRRIFVIRAESRS
jgi:hypothetical protein